MPMPEAAVHKNDGAVFGKNNVWLAGQLFQMKSKTEACCVKRTPDKDFGLGVRSLDCSHHATAGRLVNNISQRLSTVVV